jgi:hypothetical protein
MLTSPYLRLCLNEGGINDALLLSLAGDETNHHAVLDMFDDPYYDSATAAAVQLSLTQRLAFPQLLVDNDPESDKQNNRHQQRNQLPREEGSLNFFAKIITFLVGQTFFSVLYVDTKKFYTTSGSRVRHRPSGRCPRQNITHTSIAERQPIDSSFNLLFCE